MSEKLKEIISSIKKENPDASEGGIEKAFIDCIESNLPKILAKIKLPDFEELRISSRDKMYQQARYQVKSEKQREDRSKTELVHTLTAIQGDFSSRGMKKDADRFTKHIIAIEGASIAKKEVLMYIDSDLSEMIKREETVEEDRSRTTSKLKELGGRG
jgi:hypothetical protein